MKIKKYDEYRKSFPYYKVQYWDSYVSAWHDIQKMFKTLQEAILNGESKGKKFRVMKITRTVRKVVWQ